MNHLELATNQLLVPGGISQQEIQNTLHHIMERGMDYADLYFQQSTHEYWSLEDGVVRDASYDIDSGVGVRAVQGEKTGFAYSDEMSAASLMQAASSARIISSSGQAGEVRVAAAKDSGGSLYPAENPLQSVTAEKKVELLQNLDQWARGADPRVIQVMASLTAAYDVVLVAGSDATLAADVRPLVRLNVSVIVEQGGRRETGSYGFGGRSDLSL
ncbi:MAG TPA: metalloprotease TldD, partial [Gammaproteobacteria bacterium]|nr:metalloprotease TldD [Gammaproteobacteria bacterium]